MFNKYVNPVVLLLIFGLYFVTDFLETNNYWNMIYGLFLLIYYIRCKVIQKKLY